MQKGTVLFFLKLGPSPFYALKLGPSPFYIAVRLQSFFDGLRHFLVVLDNQDLHKRPIS